MVPTVVSSSGMVWKANFELFSVAILVEEAIWFEAVFLLKETDLCFIGSTMNKKKYMEELEEFLLPFAYCAYETRRTDFVFMQVNAPVHSAHDCLK